MRPRFAVDFDGTLVEDDKYPAIGDWIPGAARAVRELERHGEVVIWSCRTAPAHHLTEEPRPWTAVLAERDAIRAKLAEENLEHLEIWTKPYKPPAAAYIDNKAVAFRGIWGDALADTYDLIAPITPAPLMFFKEPGKTVAEEKPRFPDLMGMAVKGGQYFLMDGRECDRWGKPLDEVDEPRVEPYGRHPNSQRFHDLLEEAGALHDKKQRDYGKGDDPFANVRSSEDWGLPGWVGAMVRLNDKVKRLQTFAQTGELSNEGAIDSFMDIAVYALIARVLLEEDGV